MGQVDQLFQALEMLVPEWVLAVILLHQLLEKQLLFMEVAVVAVLMVVMVEQGSVEL